MSVFATQVGLVFTFVIHKVNQTFKITIIRFLCDNRFFGCKESFPCLSEFRGKPTLPGTETWIYINTKQSPHVFNTCTATEKTQYRSTPLLTRSNFNFPSGRFLYKFTIDNSNHVCRVVKQSSILPFSH